MCVCAELSTHNLLIVVLIGEAEHLGGLVFGGHSHSNEPSGLSLQVPPFKQGLFGTQAVNWKEMLK